MSLFCINKNDSKAKLLIELFGEEAAHNIFNLNKGHFVHEDSEGKPDPLFKEVLNESGGDELIATYITALKFSLTLTETYKSIDMGEMFSQISLFLQVKDSTQLPLTLQNNRIRLVNIVNTLTNGKYQLILYNSKEAEEIQNWEREEGKQVDLYLTSRE